MVQPTCLFALSRPKAPRELTAEQAREWQAVVESLPADWFPKETHPLLIQYCRHIVRARRLAVLLDAIENGPRVDQREYNRLAMMAQRETLALTTLATKMRLSQHASYSKKRAKDATYQAKPWAADAE